MAIGSPPRWPWTGATRRRIGAPTADKGYDSDKLRTAIRAKGAKPVIPGRKSRKRKVRFDKTRYKFRWMAEAVFCRLKGFRRVATRYDKLAKNYASALAVATFVAYWV